MSDNKTVSVNDVLRAGAESYEKGNFEYSAGLAKRIIEQFPDDVNALYLAGMSYFQMQEFKLSCVYLNRALQIIPNHSDAYFFLGNSFYALGMYKEAEIAFRNCININPDNSSAHNCLGVALDQQDMLFEAIESYKNAIDISPKFASAYYNLANAFRDTSQMREAIKNYEYAVMLAPDNVNAMACYLHQLQHTCQWDQYEEISKLVDQQTNQYIQNDFITGETPFIAISRNMDDEINFKIAKSWAMPIEKQAKESGIKFDHLRNKTKDKKLTIGYISKDFQDRPTAHLMLGVFREHNLNEYNIIAYSYGEDNSGNYRQEIKDNCSKFVDISNLTDQQAAQLIYDDKVDILIDLQGYMLAGRLAIAALRPAPIQISYLGFPGTIGADFFDYIITDPIVTPESQEPYFSEKFLYMPGCYQANDNQQHISDIEFSRSVFDLPEDAFIFCSFNQAMKIERIMFDKWMEILKAVPNSVLWLWHSGVLAAENIKKEAEKAGVDPSRIIFTNRLPKDQHLARIKLADLALDTRICGGHTTTSDALWAGVPVLTLQGKHFASRVCSSLLENIGLRKMITTDIDDYVAKAVELGNNPNKVKELKNTISENRLSTSLFDTSKFTANLEKSYKIIWDNYVDGKNPNITYVK
ncbi:tetratricopeptide repeat protein [Rickettsiales bacterium]|nr:tetratricopeptide repeat protein [Rickettsiales bacterium]